MPSPDHQTESPDMPRGASDARKPIPLSPRYLTAVRAMENLPSNQDGADKSWVWRAMEVSRLHFEKARRVS